LTHHDHHHEENPGSRGRELRLYSIAFFLSLFTGIAEIWISFFRSGSVALFGDAAHGISDGLTYGMLAVVILIAMWRPAWELTSTKICVWLAFLTLFIGDYLVFSEAIERIFTPHEILSEWTFFTAGASMILNGIVVGMMHKIPKHEHNIRHDSMSFHALSDLFVSVGVIGSAVIIFFTGCREVDWIMALLVAFYLAFLLCSLALKITRGEWKIGHDHEHYEH